MPNNSRSKDSKTTKFDQVRVYNKRNIFLQKSCIKWGKTKFLQPSFNVGIVLNLGYNKNNFYKTLDYWSRDMLNFNFLEKCLGIVSPPHWVYDFSRKKFFLLYFINWLNFIAWLHLLLEILANMCIAIVC